MIIGCVVFVVFCTILAALYHYYWLHDGYWHSFFNTREGKYRNSGIMPSDYLSC
jgi:mannose/fructose/N-acetylgalactosamine-specific phosphotransferase system component IID